MDAPPVQYARTSDGVSIAYISIGAGQPVVFASNIFGDANFYRLNVLHYRELPDQLVAAGFRAIVMDVRGMGSSDRIASEVSLDAWTKDVEAVVRHLGLQRFALCGSDIGAATAIAYAYKHPEEVSHLILFRPWRIWQKKAAATLQMIQSMKPLTEQQWAATSKFITSMVTGFHADSDEVASVALTIQKACSPEQYNAYMDARVDIELTDLLPELKASTLVLHIPDMILSTYEESSDIAARIPDALLVEYNPPATFARLFEFLRETKVTTTRVAPGNESGGLSSRELEVLRLIAAGRTNPQIAKELVISLNTVQRHVSSILAKTGAANRTEAAVDARNKGMA